MMTPLRKNILTELGIRGDEYAIAWDITPSYTYGLFECRGERDRRVRSKEERYYYFYIDHWQQPPRLCLMERGIRHARVLAVIRAPQGLLADCIAEQGCCKDRSYAINQRIREWLEEHLFHDFDPTLVLAGESGAGPKDEGVRLPEPLQVAKGTPVGLRDRPAFLQEDAIGGIVRSHDFFERDHNPTGGFQGGLADNRDGVTVTDLATGLVWQRGGTDLLFFRRVVKEAEKANATSLAGFSGWRLPTLEEVLSLLVPAKNAAGLHIAPCFTSRQGFLYTADRHKPGGYWFVDLRQAKVFWAGGTLSGGFGRFCRSG